MEGNPESASLRRGRACAPWKSSDVWTVSARCCTRCLHAERLSAFRRQQACLAFLDQMRPCGRSTYLSATTIETVADSPSGSDWRMVQLLNLGRRALGPNYRQ